MSLLATVLVAEGVVDEATPFAPGDQLQFALITDDPEGETLDAVVDHNDIRDGVRDAHAAQVGTDRWPITTA